MYYLGLGWFILGPSRNYRGSLEAATKKKTSLAFNLSSCNTWYNLHRLCVFVVFFNDTRLVCICCNVRWRTFSSLSSQFLAGTFFSWGFFALCCNSSSLGESLFYDPSIHTHTHTKKKWLDDFFFPRWPMHAPWTLINTSWRDGVCKYKRAGIAQSVWDEQKTC